MQLTRITLNLASRQARGDLADPYEMHSTLARAFAASADVPPDRFFWRAEPGATSSPVILVQAETAGRWGDLRHDRPDWALRIESREWDPALLLRSGMAVSFRLRANPSVTREGKRRALLKEDEQLAWLDRQLLKAGIEPQNAAVRESGKLNGRRRKDGGAAVTVHQVLFEGRGRLLDAGLTTEAVRTGIGHAKMLGLGLLSLAPLTA
jgi:CRISPR system Cascade subunit CasE